MDTVQFAFDEELYTTLGQFASAKDAVAPLETTDYLYAGMSSRLAPSGIIFDASPHKRPRLMSTPSSTSSIPSLVSAPSTASSRSSLLLSPTRDIELSPLSPGAQSPLDPGLFAALQATYLDGERSAAVGGSLPTSPIGDVYHGRVSTSSPIRTSSKPIRRSTTLSPRARPVVTCRAPRPPPLDLSDIHGASRQPAVPLHSGSYRVSPAVGEEMRPIAWDMNAQRRPVIPMPPQAAPAPALPYRTQFSHYNVAGVSLDLRDLDILGSAASLAPVGPIAVWPMEEMIMSAPACDMVDPFSGPYPPMSTVEPYRLVPPNLYPPYIGVVTPGPPTLVHRPRSAPNGSALCLPRRSFAPGKVTRKTSFVNFTSADATKLLSGVAPSGSSKRKREEEEVARGVTEKRRAVTA